MRCLACGAENPAANRFCNCGTSLAAACPACGLSNAPGNRFCAQCEQALALALELGLRPLQAHCHLDLGRLYCRNERRADGRTELTTAVELFRSMGMAFWLPRAEAKLAKTA